MSKHTPGPWYVDSRNNKIKDRGGFERIATYESEANARLISAAPDLLAALKELADIVDELSDGKLTTHTARAAIAKAEGRRQGENVPKSNEVTP